MVAAFVGSLLAAQVARADHQVHERVSVYSPAGFTNPVAAYAGSSADGARLFFSVAESGFVHGVIFERTANTTTMVSADEDGQPHPANVLDVSGDGSSVFFETSAQLTSGDLDTSTDIYERSAGVTRMVSTGPADPQNFNTPYTPFFSDDGTHAVFATGSALVPEDQDGGYGDVYERIGNTIRLVSVRPDGTPGTSQVHAGAAGITSDGSKVLFGTDESLVPEDGDALGDLYERAAGTTRLVTDWVSNLGGIFTPVFRAYSDDGARAIVSTAMSLDPADLDNEIDVYELVGSQRNLLSRGSAGGPEASRAFFQAATPDATTVWFATADQLTADDTDTTPDIYKRSGGTTTLVSTGPTAGADGNVGLAYVGQGNNGARSFFNTREQLVAQDTDTVSDIYERTAGTTTLVTPDTDLEVLFKGVSQNGSRVFFSTPEQLVAGDADAHPDVYERFLGSTYLVSLPGSSPAASTFAGALVDGSVVFLNTRDQVGADTDGLQDAYAVRLPDGAGYPRPRGATPVRFSLVPAAAPCTAPNRMHGPPLAFGSCNPPVSGSPNLTVGVGDGSLAFAKSQGHVRMEVIVGAPGGIDDSDLGISLALTNVMNKPSLSDYTGELRATADVRLTDRAQGVPATTELEFGFTVPCAATADTTLGGDCRVFTSADAVVPGSAAEGTRAIWGLGQMRVFDGGVDGDGDTAGDNSLLAVQGVFVP